LSLTELALLDDRRPLPLWDVIGLTLTLSLNPTFALFILKINIKYCNVYDEALPGNDPTSEA
jgi:hypothetical protein